MDCLERGTVLDSSDDWEGERDQFPPGPARGRSARSESCPPLDPQRGRRRRSRGNLAAPGIHPRARGTGRARTATSEPHVELHRGRSVHLQRRG
jgi:hypothetical protein